MQEDCRHALHSALYACARACAIHRCVGKNVDRNQSGPSAAMALANPNVTAKERLRVEQIYYQLVRDHPQSVPAQNALAAFLWKNGKVEAAVEHWRTAPRLEPKNV